MTPVKPTKKQFKCDYCEKFLASKASLKSHVTKIHESKKPEKKCNGIKNNEKGKSKTFSCVICEEKFASKVSLAKHTQTLHEGKKCSICQIGFANMLAHKDCFMQNPFPCKFCNSWFKTEEIRNDHQVTHNLFTCEFCFQNIETEKFDSHVCQEENDPQPSTSETFSCKFCSKEFASNESMKKHNEKVHEAKVSLQQCDSGLKVLPSEQELKKYSDNQLRGIINDARPDYHSVMRFMDNEYPETTTKTKLLEKKVEDFEKIFSVQQNYQPIYFEEIPIAEIDYKHQETFQCDECERQFAAKSEFFDEFQKETNIQINYVCPHKVKIDFKSEVHEEKKTPEFLNEPQIEIQPAENDTETHNNSTVEVHEEKNDSSDVNLDQVETEEQFVDKVKSERKKPFQCKTCNASYEQRNEIVEHCNSHH